MFAALSTAAFVVGCLAGEQHAAAWNLTAQCIFCKSRVSLSLSCRLLAQIWEGIFIRLLLLPWPAAYSPCTLLTEAHMSRWLEMQAVS